MAHPLKKSDDLKLQHEIQFKDKTKFSNLEYSKVKEKAFKKSHETYLKYNPGGGKS